MEDPTKTFQPGKKITLFDKSKQKYAIGALLIKTEESIPEQSTTKEDLHQENSPSSPSKEFSWIQILSIIITQIIWIYLLFIHKTTSSIFNSIKQIAH